MKILMFTNTFLPQTGGVIQSILTLRRELEELGHPVLLVAPGMPPDRGGASLPWVLPVPAMVRAFGSEWTAPLLLPRWVRLRIKVFEPDVVHSHHPFLLGRSALRIARDLGLPCVYSCHTRYELYARLGRVGGATLERLVTKLVADYCAQVDAVIAPSRSLQDLLRTQGVTTPISVIPTGYDPQRVLNGDGAQFRRRHGIAPDGFVVGHLGRLTVEKNLDLLLDAVLPFLAARPRATLVLGGDGPLEKHLHRRIAAAGLMPQVVTTGRLDGRAVADMLAAIDVFAFTSFTETQGLVLLEAQAAGCLVVALDAPGVRETVGNAGWLLPENSPAYAITDALQRLETLPRDDLARLGTYAAEQAGPNGPARMAKAVATLYGTLTQTDGRVWRGPVRRAADLYPS